MADIDGERLYELRTRLYKCTELRAEALDPDDRRKWLVDVFADEDDPVLEIIDKITWSDGRCVALGISGGSGVGKTTQLFRLIEALSEIGMVGIRVGYEDYSSLSSPPDVTDFLLSVLGGFADAAIEAGHLPPDWDEQSLNSRVTGILQRLRFQPEMSVGPIKVQASLREDESFRILLRKHLAGQVSALVKEIRSFVTELTGAIREHNRDCRGVVMIVDSTERLSAPASAELEMQNAVRNLFIQNGDNLRFEDLHCIYLLPPWLPISDGGALRLDTVVFPSVRVARRNGEDDERGLALLNEMVALRMPEIGELISDTDLRELYRACGGVQRVLFTLLKEVAGRARRAQNLPIGNAIVATCIDSVRQDYLAITSEAAPALRHIDLSKGVDGLTETSLAQLGRYFQALVILQVANGEKWFTIHPLMRHRLSTTNSLAT